MADAKDREDRDPFEAEDLGHPGSRMKQFLLLAAGVIVLAAGAGYGAAMFGGCETGPQAADASPIIEPEVEPEASGPGEPDYQYIDFEEITVNLDEPRLTRYVTVVLTLEIPAERMEEVKKGVADHQPAMKNWLTVYLASCTLEDVRGSVNMNRIQREICDAFNERLWPDQKPRIHQALFKVFRVQ